MGNFKHTVFFWLKEPENETSRNLFETSLKKFLDSSAFIQTKHLGTPADTNRPVVDSSYTYCLSVDFLTKDDHDKYEEDAAHKLFIEQTVALWEKVTVYDSVNIL